MMATPGLANVMAKIASPNSGNVMDPDIQFFFGGYTAYCSRTGICDEVSSAGNRLFQIFVAALLPNCVGRIDVSSNDPFAVPKLYSNFLGDEKQIQVILHGIRVAINITKTEPMLKYGLTVDESKLTAACGSFQCNSTECGSDALWQCEIRQRTLSLNHMGGTCRMGEDSAAVVDASLRVNGVQNLRVVDASIFPTMPAGNPMAIVYAVAENAAKFLIKTYT